MSCGYDCCTIFFAKKRGKEIKIILPKQYQSVLKNIKALFTTAPILKLPKYSLPFVIVKLDICVLKPY